jgi:hypothetical protein
MITKVKEMNTMRSDMITMVKEMNAMRPDMIAIAMVKEMKGIQVVMASGFNSQIRISSLARRPFEE